jgi:hypothetical protein
LKNQKKKKNKAKAKTKFIVFRPYGKPVHQLDCELVYNGKEMGMPEIPDLNQPVEKMYTTRAKPKNFSFWGTNTFHLNIL